MHFDGAYLFQLAVVFLVTYLLGLQMFKLFVMMMMMMMLITTATMTKTTMMRLMKTIKRQFRNVQTYCMEASSSSSRSRICPCCILPDITMSLP